MPLVYWGTGWFIGIALASALHLPIEFLLAAFLFPVAGFFLWRHDRRARLIWISVGFALAGAICFTLRLPQFDQNSLSTYNGVGAVTIEGVIDADPDVRDTYINLRVNADRLTTSDKATRLIEGGVPVRPSRQGVYSLIDRSRVNVLAKDQGNPILVIIYSFCERAYEVIQQILPEPRASLLSGISLGVDAALPVVVQEDFRATGTTHIITISG